MDIEAKKNILLAIVSATEQESVIDHLITIAWAKETEPERSISTKPVKKHRKWKIKIHGTEYRSLRFACLKVWGLDETQYNTIVRSVANGTDIDDLLKKRREPVRKVVPTDEFGVAK